MKSTSKDHAFLIWANDHVQWAHHTQLCSFTNTTPGHLHTGTMVRGSQVVLDEYHSLTWSVSPSSWSFTRWLSRNHFLQPGSIEILSIRDSFPRQRSLPPTWITLGLSQGPSDYELVPCGGGDAPTTTTIHDIGGSFERGVKSVGTNPKRSSVDCGNLAIKVRFLTVGSAKFPTNHIHRLQG